MKATGSQNYEELQYVSDAIFTFSFCSLSFDYSDILGYNVMQAQTRVNVLNFHFHLRFSYRYDKQ